MVGRRSVPRYAAWLRGQLHDPVAGKASDIVVVTLSVQGCCVEGFWTGDVGSLCELNIEGSESDLSVAATVVWKRPTGHTGMRFIDIHPDSLKGLQRICRTLNLQPISWPPPANALGPHRGSFAA